MDHVLILDTETTSTNPVTGKCIEVSAVRYSIRHRAVVDCYSQIILSDSNEAEHINGIPADLLMLEGDEETHAWAVVTEMALKCEAILAHNADFDHQWVPKEFVYLKKEVPWIDTCNGVTWPRETKPGMALDKLCLAHNVGVTDAHRALSDCLMLARLLTQCADFGHDVSKILARGLRPTAMFQAMVSYNDRQMAKDAGFQWEGDRKRWVRKMAIEDAAELPFRVVEVSP